MSLVAATIMAGKAHGIDGDLWCYPAAVVAFGVLPTAAAGASSALLLVWAAVRLMHVAGPAVALQFAVTLGVEVIALVTILNAVASMRRRLEEAAITDP